MPEAVPLHPTSVATGLYNLAPQGNRCRPLGSHLPPRSASGASPRPVAAQPWVELRRDTATLNVALSTAAHSALGLANSPFSSRHPRRARVG